MQYSRAGLFALLFTLIISLVSAFPIPESESPTLSSRSTPNLNGQDRPIELDTGVRTQARNPNILLRGRMSTLPLATKLNRRVCYRSFPFLLSSCIYLIFVQQQFPTETDEQLVRRNKIGDKKTHASQVCFNFLSAWYKILIIWWTKEHSRAQNQIRLSGLFKFLFS